MRMRCPVALLAVLVLASINAWTQTRALSDTGGSTSRHTPPRSAASAETPRYLVRVEHTTRADAQRWQGDSAATWLLLRSLDRDGWVRYVSFASLEAARLSGQPVWEVITRLEGPATPTRAVFADWKVADPSRAAAFEESRRALFLLRREHIPTFAGDLLMRRVDGQGEYSVLGLYADDEGLALSRGHPAIQSYAKSAPASSFTASEVSGLRFFAIDRR